MEPEWRRGFPSEDTVEPRTPTLVSCSGPGVSSGVGQVPTLISGRPGVPVDEGVVSAPISRRVRTPGDKENVLPRVHKSSSQFENADNEYFYDEYAVCSDMLHDSNVNMFHRDAPKYHVPRAQGASPEMREMWDQPRAFRPIVPGHFSHMTQQNEGPCNSPRARMSPKPKSQASFKGF